MDSTLLSLLQLCDSSFPNGAFSHSFGLETYIQEGKVNNKDTLFAWLSVYLHEQLVCTDGLACRLVYEWLEQDELAAIWEMDRMLKVQNLPRESREASYKMGERMIKLGTTLYDAPALVRYEVEVQAKRAHGHPAIAFTMIAHHLAASQRTSLVAYLYNSLFGLTQNAVRAVPLGQTEGQLVILQLQREIKEAVDRIAALTYDDFGIVSPGLELAQMKHERLQVRIFMS